MITTQCIWKVSTSRNSSLRTVYFNEVCDMPVYQRARVCCCWCCGFLIQLANIVVFIYASNKSQTQLIRQRWCDIWAPLVIKCVNVILTLSCPITHNRDSAYFDSNVPTRNKITSFFEIPWQGLQTVTVKRKRTSVVF